MSKFYGTVVGMARTDATRRGGRDIRVCAQSYDGSLITRLTYNEHDELCVELQYHETSNTFGKTVFKGTMDELLRKLA